MGRKKLPFQLKESSNMNCGGDGHLEGSADFAFSCSRASASTSTLLVQDIIHSFSVHFFCCQEARVLLLKWAAMDAFVKRLSDADAEARDASSAASRPSKRLKRDNGTDSESEEPSELPVEYGPQEVAAAEAFSDETDQRRSKERVTEFENALPPTETNEEAITEYETLRSSQSNAGEERSGVKTAPLWIKGRSSIYVDAFNLALDTVLEEESSLFSSRESEIFKQWRSLNYEAQYL